MKCPLFSRSGYFKNRLKESSDLELPQDFPGGAETFEMIALFMYGSSTLIDPFNVAALRCAAEFLEMAEDHSIGNLCERFDLYLNQVVLQSWDDTLIVLQKCQKLLPWSEELLIVGRCIESLAFMACMEILDPERRRDQPIITVEALANQSWSSETVMEIANEDLWIKDLIALPFQFFKRIIGSLRRQGMKEKYVSPIIVFYASKWVLSEKTRKFWEHSGEKNEENDHNINNKVSIILQGVLDLLPVGEKARRVIPVGFYLALLSRSLQVSLRSDSKAKLQDQIVPLLHLAQVEDLLLPRCGKDSISSSMELATMERIFSNYVSANMDAKNTPSVNNIVVAQLWDVYLSQVAPDPNMGPKRFMHLIEIVPISGRQNHDHLYKAMNAFLQVSPRKLHTSRFYAVLLKPRTLIHGNFLFLQTHPDISQEEKGMVCKYLSCQKLSQEVCIEAVQNELMPLRLIVQALFVQQMSTHQAFKECSDSFRYAHCGEFSGSLSSSRYPNSKSQNLGESPYMDGELCSRPLSFLLQKDPAIMQSCELSKKDYESTSFRIQNLEQELMLLKRNLQWQSMSKKTEQVSNKSQSLKSYVLDGRTLSKNRNTLGQATGCIGAVNFASQRKYAGRLLKVFRRITLFGRGKSKRKPGPKPSAE